MKRKLLKAVLWDLWLYVGWIRYITANDNISVFCPLYFEPVFNI
jgi:hypothetical protein